MDINAEILVAGIENQAIFNVRNEWLNAILTLSKRVNPSAVLEYVSRQVEFVLAEYGVGEALAIQPPYWIEVQRMENNLLEVKAMDIASYGDQLESFEKAQGFPESIAVGLRKANAMLAEAKVGEAVVIVSPMDFYEQHGSKYDVMNVMRVTGVREDGTRQVEGRYLLLDGKLKDYQRAWLLNYMGERAMVPADAGADLIVSSPQKFWLSERMLDRKDPLGELAKKIAGKYEDQFGKRLLRNETSFLLYKTIKLIVSGGIESLVNKLINGKMNGVVSKLREMIIMCQKNWAEFSGIDVDQHIAYFLAGQLAVGGIHGGSVNDGETNDVGEETGAKCNCERCGKICSSSPCGKCKKNESFVSI